MGKSKKVKTDGKKKMKDLGVKDSAKAITGGLTSRKAGGTQQEYLVVKLNDTLISGVQ